MNKEKIYINYGKDMEQMTIDLMEKSKVSEDLKPDMNVIIKPNLVMASPAENGATSHVEIVEGIVKYLQDMGIFDISIAEGSWVGEKRTDNAFKVCGYSKLSKKYSLKLIDTKKEDTLSYKLEGINFRVSKIFKTTDYLINVPVLKGHCQTKLTCCLKNLKGCIPDKDKRHYHTLGLNKPIALLNTILKPDLHIIDAICGNLVFEEGGNPVESNRILLGHDPLLLDSYCSKLIAYNIEEIGYIKYALKYDVGKLFDDNTEIIELNKGNKPSKEFLRSVLGKKLEKYIDEDASCSPCYANLIFALNKLENPNLVNNEIKIGQGFRGKTDFKDLGIGDCCKNFSKNVKGCPPNGLDILNTLKKLSINH